MVGSTEDHSRRQFVNWRILSLLLAFVAIVVFGVRQIEPAGETTVNAYSQLEAPAADVSAYARAIDPRDWQFPRDHGAHPQFQTEWWYYTGVLAADNGRRFGYQFTIFRRALSPLIVDIGIRVPHQRYLTWRISPSATSPARPSITMCATVVAAADWRGRRPIPRLRVWLEEWQILAASDDATTLDISSRERGFRH